MKYSFKCPACEHMITVDAMSDDEAVNKIMQEGASHMKTTHPELPPTPDDQMRQMVQSQMKKEETQGMGPGGTQGMGGQSGGMPNPM